MPIIPRFETVRTEPVSSCSASLPPRACSSSRSRSAASSRKPFRSASRRTATSSPYSSAIARPTFAASLVTSSPSSIRARRRGCSRSVFAAAATMASVYDAPAALRFSLAAVISTSREMENCGCSRTLLVMRSPMAFRMRESGSLFSREGATGEAAADEAAASTSSRVTRPPGPLPRSCPMSTPSSCARLRAAGDERTRSPSEAAGASTSEGPRAMGSRPEAGGPPSRTEGFEG